jgi:hypothetical protein
MRARFILWIAAALVITIGTAFAWQLPFRQYPGVEHEDEPLPADWETRGEWTFARLMYPAVPGFGFRGNPNWKIGRANWTIDYPDSDRHLSEEIRRLTRIHARSVEQPIDLDDDDVFNYPFLYAVEVGYWDLTDEQIVKFREYLMRGGFFMCDDFHGTQEWRGFMAVMSRILPGRAVVDIPKEDQIFHVIFDLDEKFQVPGLQYVYSHQTWEKDGVDPHWRGIYDDNGRLMVAICHDMDLGDSWEHADNPEYPVAYTQLGMRIGVNYVAYAMTH